MITPHERNAIIIMLFGIIIFAASFVILPSASIIGTSFTDNFSSGNFSNWTFTVGTPTIVASPSFQGTHSAQFTGTSSITKDISGVPVIEFELYIPSAPISTTWSDVNFLTVYASDMKTNCQVQYFSDGSGHVGFELASGSSYPNFNYAIQSSTWYKVDLVTSYTSSGGYTLYVNDQLVGSLAKNLSGLTSARYIVGSVWSSSSTFDIAAVSIGTSYTPTIAATPTPVGSTPTPVPTPIPTASPNPTQTVTLTFTVVDSNSNPISGATVHVEKVGSTQSYILTTDANGVVTQIVTQGAEYNCYAISNGLSSMNTPVVASTSTSVTLLVSTHSTVTSSNSDALYMQLAGAGITVVGAVSYIKKKPA